MVNIKGLDKAAVLAALHNGTEPLGLGVLHARGDMTPAEAQEVIDHAGSLVFDYVHGRPLKVDISGDEFSPHAYDRDAGDGAAERAIAPLRGK